jgi:hypothetical protein
MGEIISLNIHKGSEKHTNLGLVVATIANLIDRIQELEKKAKISERKISDLEFDLYNRGGDRA